MIGNEMILGETASGTLAISSRPVAVAAYLHFGQLQIQRVRISSSGRLESDITVPMLESDSTVVEIRIRQQSGPKLEFDSTVGQS